MADGTRGPRSKLTPERQAAIVQLLAEGNDQEVAAQAAGIGTRTFYSWMAQGREALKAAREQLGEDDQDTPLDELDIPDKQRPLAAFAAAVEKALAEAETVMVGHITSAARTTWQAAAWYLERRYPDRWGKVERQIQMGDPDSPLTVQVEYVDTPPKYTPAEDEDDQDE